MFRYSSGYALGLLFLVIAACIWAGSSILTQYIYTDLHFQSPFLLTYITSSLFAIYLPIFQLCVSLGLVPNRPTFWSQQQHAASSIQQYSQTHSAAAAAVSSSSSTVTAAGEEAFAMYRPPRSSRSTSNSDEESIDSSNGIDDSKRRLLHHSSKAKSSERSEGGAREKEGVNTAFSSSAVAVIGGEGESSRASTSTTATTRQAKTEASSSSFSSNVHDDGVDGEEDDGERPTRPYSHIDVIRVALIISPLWFIANCLYNYSLLLTSVSSSTIISNLSASFTLAFSAWAGLEKITIGKVLGLILCFVGAIVVGLEDSNVAGSDGGSNGGSGGGERTTMGDIVALLAALGYGLYTTVIRRQIPDENGISMQLVLGYIGLINMVLLSPAIIAIASLELDNIQMITGTVFGFIIMGGICDQVISDYLWARAVVLTSPTVATVGMSITIPLAFVSDLVLGKPGAGGLWATVGAMLVIFGFLFVNSPDVWWEKCMPFMFLDALQNRSEIGVQAAADEAAAADEVFAKGEELKNAYSSSTSTAASVFTGGGSSSSSSSSSSSNGCNAYSRLEDTA